jgi:hypothetical protein
VCGKGYIHIIKWLLEIRPQINLSTRDEHAFRGASIGGHVEIVKYLIERNPNIKIDIDKEYTFQSICEIAYYFNMILNF